MQKKVFISYVEKDLKTAKIIKDRLLEENIYAWIYAEDNIAGDYRTGIIEAISNSEVMILIFSKDTENSLHISKELREASENNVTIIPFFIEDIKNIKNASIRYEIQTLNWIPGWRDPLEEQINILIDKTKSVLDSTSQLPSQPTNESQPNYYSWLKIVYSVILLSTAVSGSLYLYNQYKSQIIKPSDEKINFSQANIEQFLTSFLTMEEDNSPDKCLSYYASLVKPYKAKEQATRKEILQDRIDYIKRWPSRIYNLKSFSLLERGNNYGIIGYTIDWKVNSDTRSRISSGVSSFIIKIKEKDDKFFIVEQEEISTTQNSTSVEMLTNKLSKQ